MQKRCQKFLNPRQDFFRAIASADVRHFRRKRVVCDKRAYVALSSLKISCFCLKAFSRKMMDNETPWKSLNRWNLKTGSDVIKTKKLLSPLFDVLSVLKVSWKSIQPFSRNHVHTIAKKKKTIIIIIIIKIVEKKPKNNKKVFRWRRKTLIRNNRITIRSSVKTEDLN